jgi:hypothetical protein
MSAETGADVRQSLKVHAADADRHSEIVITVTPDTRPGRYRANVETEREPLCISRQPFFDGARELIARGHDPRTMLVMRWAGSKDWALRGPLGAAAKLTVDEHNGTTFAKWKPFPRSVVSHRIAKTANTVPKTGGLIQPLIDGTAEKPGERSCASIGMDTAGVEADAAMEEAA